MKFEAQNEALASQPIPLNELLLKVSEIHTSTAGGTPEDIPAPDWAWQLPKQSSTNIMGKSGCSRTISRPRFTSACLLMRGQSSLKKDLP
jgi:hypothetical protein